MKTFVQIIALLAAGILLSIAICYGVNRFLARNDVRVPSSELTFVTEYPFRGECHVKDKNGKRYKVRLQAPDGTYQYTGGFLTWKNVQFTDTVTIRPL